MYALLTGSAQDAPKLCPNPSKLHPNRLDDYVHALQGGSIHPDVRTPVLTAAVKVHTPTRPHDASPRYLPGVEAVHTK